MLITSRVSLSQLSLESASTTNTHDYVSALSNVVSVITELTQYIFTTTSDGSTIVSTTETPLTTTVTVSANGSVYSNMTSSIPAATISSGGVGGATTSAEGSGAGKFKVRGWSISAFVGFLVGARIVL
jgi:hypothetical protein